MRHAKTDCSKPHGAGVLSFASAIGKDYLSAPQLVKKWDEQSQDFSPVILEDYIGRMQGLLNIERGVSWTSLYALSVLVLERIQGYKNSVVQPSSLSQRGRDPLFVSAVEKQLKSFDQFMRRWGISRHFERYPFVRQPPNPTNEPTINDGRIIGLNFFPTYDAVEDYITLWKKNTNLDLLGISDHGFILSRRIDLIVSELLSNAFEHGMPSSHLLQADDARISEIVLPAVCDTSDGLGRQLAKDLPASIKKRLDTEDLASLSDDKDVRDALKDALNNWITSNDLTVQSQVASSTRLLSHASESDSRNLQNRLLLETIWPGLSPSLPFVMAKLLIPSSCRRSLDLHHYRNHLTWHERALYTEARDEDFPILQLIIADPGSGFGGNVALSNKFRKNYSRVANEDELISWALRPEVTSKRDSGQAEREWLKYFDNRMSMEDFRPTIHGLSEVDVVVREAQGFWRIHSNGCIHDLVHLPYAASKEDRKLSTLARRVPGTINYLCIPLRRQPARRVPLPSDSTTQARSTSMATSPPVKIKVIDAAVHIYKNCKQVDSKSLRFEKGIRNLADALLEYSPTQASQCVTLLNLTAFDGIPGLSLPGACAVLADTLHRARTSQCIVICGASKVIQSNLIRSGAWRKLYLDCRVVPRISFENEREEIDLICASDLPAELRKVLTSALNPSNHDEIQLSDHPKLRSDLYKIAAQNAGLFKITALSRDEVFKSLLPKLSFEDSDSTRILLGGRSFSEFSRYLQSNKAIAYSKAGFLRLGRLQTWYIHMSYLWADALFRSDVTFWFKVALKNILQGSLRTSTSSEVTLLCVLHPAVDIAPRVLSEDEELRGKVQILPIRRLVECRWDSPTLMLAANSDVVIITDLIQSGRTLSWILTQLKALSARHIGTMVVLSIKSVSIRVDANASSIDSGMPTFAFSECSSEHLETLARSTGNASERRAYLVDADTQSTSQLKQLPEGFPHSLVDSRSAKLIKGGALLFGHAAFGWHRHNFSIRVNMIGNQMKNEIIADIVNKCKKVLKGDPDLILCPSGSGLISWIEQERFGAGKTIALNRVWRGGAQHRFQLEIGASSRVVLSQGKPLKILFLDYSFSSGNSELLAQENYRTLRERFSPEGARSDDSWMTYVLCRGQDARSLKLNEANTLGSESQLIGRKSLVSHFASLADFNLRTDQSPFGPALTQVRRTLKWLRFGPPRVKAMLENLATHISPDRLDLNPEGSSKAILAFDATIALLGLCSCSNEVNATFLNSETPKLDPATSRAALIYSAMHFPDLSAYVPEDTILGQFSAFADKIVQDSPSEAVIMLLGLTFLPPSAAVRAVENILPRLLSVSSPVTAASAASIAICSLDHCALDHYVESRSYGGVISEEDSVSSWLELERGKFLANLQRAANLEKINADSMISDAAWQLSTELTLLSGSSLNQPRSALTSARELATLLSKYSPNHGFDLRRKICAEDPDSWNDVKATLILALERYRHLADSLGVEISKIVTDFSLQLKNSSNSGEAKTDAERIFNFLWESGPIARHFVKPLNICNWFNEVVDEIIGQDKGFERLGTNLESHDVFRSIFPKEGDSIWRFRILSPDSRLVREHFKNILLNPLRHGFKSAGNSEVGIHRVVEALNESPKVPVTISILRHDASRCALQLLTYDRGDPLETERPFDPGRALGMARMRFELFGGSVRYCLRPDGLVASDDLESIDEDLRKVLEDEVWQFNNLIITEWPILYDERT